MTSRASRVGAALVVVTILWVAVIIGLLALGTWQVERRAWKLGLIAQVEAGLKATPVAAPTIARPGDAYRRVVASGNYLPGRDSFVQAVTVRGPGWWVMTPLRTEGGRVLMINRGYVAARRASPVPEARVAVTGLLRLTEPGGGFLRSNDPRTDRWYSRDVVAIASQRGVGPAAPYFIDADSAGNGPGRPVGGLTVISFPNNHLGYAVTWYTLAVMAAAGFYYWIGLGRRRDGEAAA